MSRIQHLLLALLGVTLIVGCGGDDDSSASGGGAADSSNAGATPQETFAAFQKAVKEEDWKTASGHLTDESQARLAFSMVIASAFVAAFDESKADAFEQLLEKHGLEEDAMAGSEPESEAAAIDMMNSMVKDKPALLQDLLAFMDQGESDGEGGFTSIGSAVPGKISIEGDHAHGTLTVDGEEEPLDFVRVDGVWKLELPERKSDMALGESEMTFGDGGMELQAMDSFDLGGGGFSDNFDFEFDESDDLPPVSAIAIADLDDAWKVSVDITDQPALEVIEGLAGECGLEIYEPEEHDQQLSQTVTLSLSDVSRLEVIERVCEQVGLYPRYKLRKLAFAEGPRPHPVAFAGPFLISVSQLQEMVPYTAGSLQLQVFSAGLPIGLLSQIKSLSPSPEEADDALTLWIEKFTGSNGEELLTEMQGGYESLVSTTTCLMRFDGSLSGLTSDVETIAMVKGDVTLPVPTEVQSLSFPKLEDKAEQSVENVTVKLTDVEIGSSPDDGSSIGIKFTGISMDNLSVAGMDKDGNILRVTGSGGYSTDEGGQYSIYFEGVAASLEIRAVTQTERVRYPFELAQIPLPNHAAMPDSVVELQIDGDSPITAEFTGFIDDGDDRNIGLKLTNHTNLPMSSVTLNLSYLNGAGEEIDNSPHGHSGGLEMIPAGESFELEVSAFFMPDDCEDVAVTASQITFANLSEWYADE